MILQWVVPLVTLFTRPCNPPRCPSRALNRTMMTMTKKSKPPNLPSNPPNAPRKSLPASLLRPLTSPPTNPPTPLFLARVRSSLWCKRSRGLPSVLGGGKPTWKMRYFQSSQKHWMSRRVISLTR